MEKHDLVIIGTGPAGMAAAAAAYDAGVSDIVMIDREVRPGGILLQCVHIGFGFERFGKEMSGPEYAAVFEQKLEELGIKIYSSSMVTSITKEREVTYQNQNGFFTIKAGAIILAMGCRERSRGAVAIPGSRPAGVYTAGIAQKLVNCEGYTLGKKVFVLGSGDIGLIMADRLKRTGADVLAVCELMPYSNGTKKNMDECLVANNIPLLLSHTVTEIHGKNRVEGVTVAEVDKARRPVPGTEKFYECDTLLLSVGLIPENELTELAGIPISPVTKGPIVDQFRQTLVEGIFACGNVLHVHDLVDFVSNESELAGRSAAEYLKNPTFGENFVSTERGENVSYIIPHRICVDLGRDMIMLFRVKKPMEKVRITVESNDTELASEYRERVLPGKMEKIKLSGRKLPDLTGTVKVSVVKA